MKHVIKNRQIVPDNWRHLTDEDELVAGDITLGLNRWLARDPVQKAHQGRIGVRLEGDDDPSLLLPELPHLPLIVLHFPRFTDGRCYSLARLLRGRHNYMNELRATGDILRDQLVFMMRCGIDAFEIEAAQNIKAVLRTFEEMTVQYQPDIVSQKTASRFRAFAQEVLA